MTSSALYCVGLHFSHIIIPKLTTAREPRLCTSLLVLDILRGPPWTQSLLFSILPPRSWLSRRTCLLAFCWIWHAMQEIEEWGGKSQGVHPCFPRLVWQCLCPFTGDPSCPQLASLPGFQLLPGSRRAPSPGVLTGPSAAAPTPSVGSLSFALSSYIEPSSIFPFEWAIVFQPEMLSPVIILFNSHNIPVKGITLKATKQDQTC